jgi:hypothetical protein
MPSDNTTPATHQNEIARHATRYVLFIVLALLGLWFSFHIWTDYTEKKAYLENLIPGEDGYIYVSDKWIRIDPPEGAAMTWVPEGQSILISTDSNTKYESTPNGELYYLNGERVVSNLTESSRAYFFRAKDPAATVKVKINYRRH